VERLSAGHRVDEQRVGEPVADVGAADVGEQVLVAVLVDVAERDAVALLEVAGAGAVVTSLNRAPPDVVVRDVGSMASKAGAPVDR
jgi:hypothetical protein